MPFQEPRSWSNPRIGNFMLRRFRASGHGCEGPQRPTRSHLSVGTTEQLLMNIPLRGKNWSEHERSEIVRLEAVCSGTDHWSLDCDHTDAGDPWCVIYDQQHHRIVLHIARIDRRYVVVWPRE